MERGAALHAGVTTRRGEVRARTAVTTRTAAFKRLKPAPAGTGEESRARKLKTAAAGACLSAFSCTAGWLNPGEAGWLNPGRRFGRRPPPLGFRRGPTLPHHPAQRRGNAALCPRLRPVKRLMVGSHGDEAGEALWPGQPSPCGRAKIALAILGRGCVPMARFGTPPRNAKGVSTLPQGEGWQPGRSGHASGVCHSENCEANRWA